MKLSTSAVLSAFAFITAVSLAGCDKDKPSDKTTTTDATSTVTATPNEAATATAAPADTTATQAGSMGATSPEAVGTATSTDTHASVTGKMGTKEESTVSNATTGNAAPKGSKDTLKEISDGTATASAADRRMNQKDSAREACLQISSALSGKALDKCVASRLSRKTRE